MIFNDYTKMKNIAHDWVRWPCVRVSSAEIPSFIGTASFGVWYETWVFSNCPKIRTIQVTHKIENKCLKAHGHIVNNLKQLLAKEA